ncbi:hypothetical protein StoSoilB13_28090 (plasmid) [Arthrobacter sp. StoSoilB13]|nr:hypothetical protein StoSoilB13_28090 [Arthrobacter sp. StoSoilB13]
MQGRLKVDDHWVLIRGRDLHQIRFVPVPEPESLVLLGGNPNQRSLQAVELFKQLQDGGVSELRMFRQESTL